MPSPLLDRFRAHLDAAGLLARPGAAIVAVSGGADSVALLDLLAAVAPSREVRLVVAHADHGIQPAARSVGQAVKALAARYELPFELGELALGADTSETVARSARYGWLGAVQRRHRARYLVTAHHQDDQIETVLLRALRGSGPAGLAGMPARGRGGLVRPLLPFTRAELAAHVAARGLPHHDDPANRDPRHLRSWLRSTLLPLVIERLGPGAGADLLRLGRQAAADRRAWDRVLGLLPDLGLHETRTGFAVARHVLASYDNALSVALLRAAARRVGLVLGPVRARRVLALARRPSGRRLALGEGWTAEVAFDRLRLTRGSGDAAAPVRATGERGSISFGEFRVSWRPDRAPGRIRRDAWTTWVEGGGGGWEVRAPGPGDRLVPAGGVGHRPVRRLLMEARVPRSERAGYPVVARGETILWVPGVCRGQVALPRPGTPAVRVDVTRHDEPEADRRP
ncbi:MAG: tRNA lysidine(34) synthetase TilS [Gemmatimonadales bacterium]